MHQDIISFATSLLGKPNYPPRSGSNEVSWGKKGSLTVCFRGEKAGFWFDFEGGIGGKNMLSLYIEKTGLPFKMALESLSKNLIKSPNYLQKILQKSTDHLQKNQETLHKNNQKKTEKAINLYEKGQDIFGTIAEKYLKNTRGIDAKIPGDFRFHPAVFHKDLQEKCPALLMPIRTQDGKMQGVVRLFLDKNARKINKKVDGKQVASRLNYGPSKNGFVHINKGKSAEILVAEGVETALSIAKFKQDCTVLASLSVSNLKSFLQENPGQKITICADKDGPDSPTKKALLTAISCYLKQGFAVSVCFPKTPFVGKKVDFNDELMGHKSKEIHASLHDKINGKTVSEFAKKIDELYQKEQKICVEKSVKMPEKNIIEETKI